MDVANIEIRSIRADETRFLRHKVLRPSQAPEELIFSGDHSPESLHLGAFLDGELVGVASVCRERCPDDNRLDAWRLQGMAVASTVQGHGCGRQLLERGIQHVADRGGTLLWCEGRTGVAGFYRAMGFELHGEEFVKPISGPHYIMKRTIMKASMPHQIPDLFLRALNSGNADAVVALYEPQGVVAPDPSQLVAGHEAIRTMVSGFLSQQPRFSLHDSEVIESGDLALVRTRWTITTTDADGKSMQMHVGPTLVVRRQADGGWLVAIDRPVPVEGA